MEDNENRLIVRTEYDHIKRMLSNASEDAISLFYDIPKNSKQIDLIGKIISLEVAYYVCRRTGSVDESTIDILSRMRSGNINQYEKTFGKWLDFNGNVNF